MRLVEPLALGAAYLRSLLAFHIDGAPRPFSATFAVTNRCNLRCSYCNSPFLDPHDLPIEQIEKLFSRLRNMGVRRLGLAGGEPLVRHDFPTVLQLARRFGFWVSVNSNLSLFKRRGESLAEANLVYTSLDGTPSAHARARGDGRAEQVIEAARELVRRGVPVVAICVVTEHNLTEAEYLLTQADKGGFRVHFQPRCVETELVRGKSDPTVPHQRWQSFWRALIEQKRRGRPIASSLAYLEVVSRWPDFSISAVFDPTQRCAAGRGFLYVDPQGRAYPCAYTKGKVTGVDLLADDWAKAWDRRTPCTRCVVGPMLEFNLLFQRPFAAVREHLWTALGRQRPAGQSGAMEPNQRNACARLLLQ